MREILFRGKELDDGDWVEGYLIRNDSICYPALFIGMIEASRTRYGELSIDGQYLPQVDPDTVGQYTGLTDKNGKRIFEGDIVKHYNMWNDPEAYDVGHVYYFQDRCKWKRTTFDGFNKTGRPIDDPEMHVSSKYEVIGNIYDNSELIAEVEEC